MKPQFILHINALSILAHYPDMLVIYISKSMLSSETLPKAYSLFDSQ